MKKLVLFNRDLRTVDNTALINAIDGETPVVGLFIATPQQWQQHDLAPIQADLVYRRLTVLSRELDALNIPLLYHECEDFDTANDWIINTVKELDIDSVFMNLDHEVNEIQRTLDLAARLQSISKKLITFDDKCVLRPGTVLNKQGKNFKVFTPFKNAWKSQFTLPLIQKPAISVAVDIPLPHQFSPTRPFSYPRVSSQDWPIETDDIIQRLREYCHDRVADYHNDRDFPSIDGTSQLSPYLAIGALSVRQCVARLYYDAKGEALSAGAEIWLSELIWREFYQHLLHFEPKLSRHEGYLPWEKNLVWQGSQDYFSCWSTGQTGYPIVDAAMRQLNATGWMHNRLRMVVASFLVKDLHIDWRQGEAYFMSKLIDGDLASNNGGWQWCASTGCDGQPYFRIFNPISQGERFDAHGEFVRQWIPELSDVPNRYIHQPWKWASFQSLDYPEPIVDHKTQREITLSVYKEAKDQH
ncbi:deoxyribodipyrimidine photo-lyase [Vibrio sp. 10N.286.49.C2]|uniref:deoxyribodipyrimidine photo-lyase n=1 Tax=unclassified Vibrio TaxID=2614977 RepID=UPI000C814EFC|nr:MULTISPECIES: deoxyribodipyrimidine photo-lyase [unclassified Vibrio]PMH42739.1 deoxyribodipyrimidine photo-lyase [Vibrio sp. 10N.286.49.C2]PMH53923.1 deoxyribodipyrimidine photo-lyase [Vibrio sp. 10N.286.49.B1]PMH79642.1 deoxyribodipyrimidine photo-lyase [Vibrio sp. 10N.286.48.B7]